MAVRSVVNLRSIFSCGGIVTEHITFDDRLAGQSIPLGYIFCAQAQAAASADFASGDLDCTPATATLPTAWLPDFDTSQVRGLTQQGARRDAHRLFCDIKGDRVLSHSSYLQPTLTA